MRRVAVVIVLVLTGTLLLAASPSAGAATAAQPAPAVRADFNGDRAADLAVGVPGESVGAVEGAGSVNVLYGSAGAGLSGAGSQLFTQAASGGAVEAGDSFGAALASGDFNGDGITDLAAGAPFEDVGSILDAGAVSVLFGTAAGLTGGGPLLTQVPSLPEEGDQFGAALVAGDFDGDTVTDLAAGTPFESVGTRNAAGAVSALFGSAGGFSPTDAQTFTQAPRGVEADDTFGWSLSAGDFAADGVTDLAAGAPFDDVGTRVDAGAVSEVPGSAGGLVPASGRLFTQDTAGMPSVTEVADAFGGALAAGLPTAAPSPATAPGPGRPGCGRHAATRRPSSGRRGNRPAAAQLTSGQLGPGLFL